MHAANNNKNNGQQNCTHDLQAYSISNGLNGCECVWTDACLFCCYVCYIIWTCSDYIVFE